MFLLCFCARLLVGDLWSPAGRGLAYCLSFVVSDCEVDTFTLYIEYWLNSPYFICMIFLAGQKNIEPNKLYPEAQKIDIFSPTRLIIQ